MYPDLYYVFRDLFGVNWPFFKIIGTFGFFMVLAFFVAAFVLRKELQRKESEGILTYTEVKAEAGKIFSWVELIFSSILTFLFGYKILGLVFMDGAMDNPQGFIFSTKGSVMYGLILMLFYILWWLWQVRRDKASTRENGPNRIWPSSRVTDIVFIAAIAGLAGAKLFDSLENWHALITNPLASLLSRSGLTFYGGLILATAALWYYMYKHKISFINICDAAAPSLILAYGIGRIGCHIAGDGDWGIINGGYLSEPDGSMGDSNTGKMNMAQKMYGYLYQYPGAGTHALDYKVQRHFWGLPHWLFAYSYPHNVIKMGVPTANCSFDEYCNHLPMPVFPTPLYEVIMALLIFAALWLIRKKIKTPGRFFAIYLILSGIERFLIELIRVNAKYMVFGLQFSQAQLISSLAIIGGIFLYWYAPKIKPAFKVSNQASGQ